eukprot:scaffold26440_cov51-Isochrysis_galbana.AAC.1
MIGGREWMGGQAWERGGADAREATAGGRREGLRGGEKRGRVGGVNCGVSRTPAVTPPRSKDKPNAHKTPHQKHNPTPAPKQNPGSRLRGDARDRARQPQPCVEREQCVRLLRRKDALLLGQKRREDAIDGHRLAVPKLEALVGLESSGEGVAEVHRAEQRLLPQ